MHTINLPVTPGAIIGYRRNGTPIRLIAGGSGEGDEGGTDNGQDSATADGSGDTGQQVDAGTGGSTGQQPANPGPAEPAAGGSTNGDKTARTIEAIRGDFKAERAKRQAAEQEVAAIKAALEADKAERTKQMDALAIALGLKSGDEPPDPAKLAGELKAARETATAEISQRDANLRQAQVELAVLRNAGRHGGNGDALLDSRSFMSRVSGLDPAADDFAEQLGDAIKAAVEASPQYKAAAVKPGDKGGSNSRQPPAPSRSGGEHTSPGGNRQWTIEDVKAASARNPAEVTKAMEDGLLVDLGYRPAKKRR